MHRLVCRGTVEDAVSRKAVQRRILTDLEQAHQVRQQTLQDLLRPQLNDYHGYIWSSSDRKKKDKVGCFKLYLAFVCCIICRRFG